MPVITLTTDFGLRDHYVACMKAVIMGIAPKATIIDATHDVESHNVTHGAFILAELINWYPPGTVHLAVIDPGVGTQRRILIGRYAGHYVIAPDNGLITFVHHRYAIEDLRVFENGRFALPNISSTFHGRDVMAPVAAHLAAGRRPADFGPQTDRVEVLQIVHSTHNAQHGVTGRIIYVDKFGNLTTNISHHDVVSALRLRPNAEVHLAGERIGSIQVTYAHVGNGIPLALMGSSGYLEIAVNGGSAFDRFKPAPDAAVELR